MSKVYAVFEDVDGTGSRNLIGLYSTEKKARVMAKVIEEYYFGSYFISEYEVDGPVIGKAVSVEDITEELNQLESRAEHLKAILSEIEEES